MHEPLRLGFDLGALSIRSKAEARVIRETEDRQSWLEPVEAAFGRLVWRPTLRSRNGVGYLTCRSWSADVRKQDLAALKTLKREMPEPQIRQIIEDLAAVARSFTGSMVGAVVPVACGHSKRLDCLSFRLANGLATAIGADLVQAFRPRFVSGSSHPKENVKLPPLEVVTLPVGPCLVVDDVATSGFHMEEAVRDLRSRGVPTIGMAWLGGVTSK